MSRTRSPSTGKPYGLARVAAAWGVPRSTYDAQRKRQNHPVAPRKRGPRTPFIDEELTARIRQEIAASRPPKVLGAPEGGRCPDLQDPGTASDAGGPAAGATAPGRSHREEGA